MLHWVVIAGDTLGAVRKITTEFGRLKRNSKSKCTTCLSCGG